VKSALIDVMSGTIYQLSSCDVMILQTLFKYINSEVKFHLPYRVRVYEQARLFFVVYITNWCTFDNVVSNAW
jgi:hypothetical protein